MKQKGFTLIELLGGIVVLTIIALITIPIISGVVNKARLNALKDSAYGLIDASELYYAQYGLSSNTRFDIDNGSITSNDVAEDKMLTYKGNVKTGTVIISTKGKTTICVTDGKNSAYKNYNESSVTLVAGKRCSVPSNTNIVYLDNEATLTALDNQELTEKVEQLEALLAQKANQSDLEVVSSVASDAQTKANAAVTSGDLESLSTIVSNKTTLNEVYPVGSIYMSVNNTNPSTLFGGTWVKIEDRFLLASGSSYTLGDTDGSTSTTLTTANLPSHSHSYTPLGTNSYSTSNVTTGNQSANHTHSFSGTTSENGAHTHNVTSDVNIVYNLAGNIYVGSGSGTVTANGSLSLTAQSNGNHTHTFSGTTGVNSANHTHTISAANLKSAIGTISFSGTASNTTGCNNCNGTSFTNMPPYLVVNIWKRTA